jgi:hypothetical protein
MRLVDEFKKKHPTIFASVDFSAGSIFFRRNIYCRSRGCAEDEAATAATTGSHLPA